MVVIFLYTFDTLCLILGHKFQGLLQQQTHTPEQQHGELPRNTGGQPRQSIGLSLEISISSPKLSCTCRSSFFFGAHPATIITISPNDSACFHPNNTRKYLIYDDLCMCSHLKKMGEMMEHAFFDDEMPLKVPREGIQYHLPRHQPNGLTSIFRVWKLRSLEPVKLTFFFF